MNLLNVLNWIGVFALAVGSLISVIHGHFITSLIAVLLTSILITSLIPLSGKLQLLLRGVPRIELVQKMGRMAGMIGVWVLAVVGGWEYLVAAVVLSVAMIGRVGMMMREMRMRRGIGSMITDEPSDKKDANTQMVNTQMVNTANTHPNTAPLTTPLPPPNYSSTVRIVKEKAPVDQQDQQKSNQVTIKIEPQPAPVFNV